MKFKYIVRDLESNGAVIDHGIVDAKDNKEAFNKLCGRKEAVMMGEKEFLKSLVTDFEKVSKERYGKIDIVDDITTIRTNDFRTLTLIGVGGLLPPNILF